MVEPGLLHEETTAQILRAFYYVHKQLGHGFLESVYEQALRHTLHNMRLHVQSQHSLLVHFDGVVVGRFIADLIVEERVIVEIKAVETLNRAHESQLLNYLKATEIEVGLLLNFGEKPEHRRRIFTNDRKNVRGT